MGIDETTAVKAANDEATVSLWIDRIGDVASEGLSIIAPTQKVLEPLGDQLIDFGVDIPKDALRDTLHTVVVRNARLGNTNVEPQDLMEQAVTEYCFILGFNNTY